MRVVNIYIHMYVCVCVCVYIYGRRNILSLQTSGRKTKVRHISGINLLIKRSLWSNIAHHQMDNRFLNKRRLRERTLASHFTNKQTIVVPRCKDPCRGYHFGLPIVVWQRSHRSTTTVSFHTISFLHRLALTTLPAVKDDALPFIARIFSLSPPSGLNSPLQ